MAKRKRDEREETVAPATFSLGRGDETANCRELSRGYYRRRLFTINSSSMEEARAIDVEIKRLDVHLARNIHNKESKTGEQLPRVL